MLVWPAGLLFLFFRFVFRLSSLVCFYYFLVALIVRCFSIVSLSVSIVFSCFLLCSPSGFCWVLFAFHCVLLIVLRFSLCFYCSPGVFLFPLRGSTCLIYVCSLCAFSLFFCFLDVSTVFSLVFHCCLLAFSIGWKSENLSASTHRKTLADTLFFF